MPVKQAVEAAVDEFLKEEALTLTYLEKAKFKRIFENEIAPEVKELAKKRLKELNEPDNAEAASQ
jgi:hypothetical protein